MVIQSASTIASISAQMDQYIIVAYVSPQDVVRVKKGNRVNITVNGLTQSIYGTITGTVVSIDSDITESQDSENNSSYFKVYIKPDEKYLVSKSGNKANISNGMTVETRIEYDEETYFDYVMEALGVLKR